MPQKQVRMQEQCAEQTARLAVRYSRIAQRAGVARFVCMHVCTAFSLAFSLQIRKRCCELGPGWAEFTQFDRQLEAAAV